VKHVDEMCAEGSSAESVTPAASVTTESSAAAQLLVNTMYPSTPTATNTTAAVRQITPSTPIVLSAEQLTCLLMNTAQQQQQLAGQSQPPAPDLNTQIWQYVAEQAASQAVTLTMDSVNVTELSGGGNAALETVSNDLDVGAQEVLDDGTAAQKQHPLHLN